MICNICKKVEIPNETCDKCEKLLTAIFGEKQETTRGGKTRMMRVRKDKLLHKEVV